MKIVPKQQKGGQFLPLFGTFTPMQGIPSIFGDSKASTPTTTAAEEPDTTKGRITEKDLFSTLSQMDGLPSDMQMITEHLDNMYDYNTVSAAISDPSGLASKYSQVVQYIKIANFNKKEWDNAAKQVTLNKGLNEIATTTNGKIVAFDDENKVHYLSVSEYVNNTDKYNAVTNERLLKMRAENKALAYNNDVFEIINNGIGIEKVRELIQQSFTKLGTSEFSKIGSISISEGKIKAGMEVIAHLSEQEQANLGIDGLYKAKVITKEQKQQAEAALSYVYKMLPTNAQTVLQLHSGDTKDPGNGALEVIWSLITSQMSPSRTVDIDLEGAVDTQGYKKGSKKDGSGDDGELKENTAMAYLQGRGYQEEVSIIPGNNIGARVRTTMVVLPGSDNKPFEGRYLDEIRTSGMSSVLDLKNATMGGNKIIIPEQVELLDNKMHSIYWPTLNDGITPDLRETTIEMKKKADDYLASMGIDPNDPNQMQVIAQVYQEVGLPNVTSLKRFTVMDARTNNNALGMDPFDDSPSLQSVDDRMTDQYEQNYNTYRSKGENKSSIDIDRDNGWLNPADWFGNYDTVYKGLVWIPMFDNYYNALAGTGEKAESSILNDLDRKQWESDRVRQNKLNYVNASQFE